MFPLFLFKENKIIRFNSTIDPKILRLLPNKRKAGYKMNRIGLTSSALKQKYFKAQEPNIKIIATPKHHKKRSIKLIYPHKKIYVYLYAQRKIDLKQRAIILILYFKLIN